MKKTVLLNEVLDAMETSGMDIKWYFDLEKEKLILVTDECLEDDLDMEEVENNNDRFIVLNTLVKTMHF